MVLYIYLYVDEQNDAVIGCGMTYIVCLLVDTRYKDGAVYGCNMTYSLTDIPSQPIVDSRDVPSRPDGGILNCSDTAGR